MSDPVMRGLHPRCDSCLALPGNPHRPGCRRLEPYFDPRLNPHEVTEACLAEHCAWHNVDEPGGSYVVCPECWHSYPSARSLRAAYRREAFKIYWDDVRGRGPKVTQEQRQWAKDMGSPIPHFLRVRALWAMRKLIFVRASKIYVCQCCHHDF